MKTKQSVKLIYSTPLWLISNAIRYSHDNHHLSDSRVFYRNNGKIETTLGSKDSDLIKRVGFKFKHKSVLEHSLLVFDIECSRAVLQELSRHRHISLTVKSTRYTLNELKKEKVFSKDKDGLDRAKKYIVLYPSISRGQIEELNILKRYIDSGLSNDITKYTLPEAFKTKLQLSVNLRELLHILELRINKDALWEFREISKQIIDELPDDYKELVLLNEKVKENYEELDNEKTI